MTKSLLRNAMLASFIIIAFFGCGQQPGRMSSGNCGIDVIGDTLTIQSTRSGIQTVSYSIKGKAFKSKTFSRTIKLNTIQLIREDNSQINEYAYEIATKGYLPIRFTIESQLDTTIKVRINSESVTGNDFAKILTGPCLKVAPKGVSVNQEREIKKWLYNQGTHIDEATIHKMAEISNALSSSSYNEFVPEEGETLPILTSFQNVQYKISTDIKADYYYLFAGTSYSEINDFIAEVVSQNFVYANESNAANFHCFSSQDKGGILLISLIAVNKDWSKKIVPLGLVVIDNIKPSVISDNIGTSGIESMLSGHNSKQGDLVNQIMLNELNARISLPADIPETDGFVFIETGQFRGDNAQFSITYRGDVESMTIKREIHRSYSWLRPGSKTITFTNQKSPIHLTYALDLAIGDNYIPITVKDKRGNVTEYSYHIEMVQVEKTNPEINIDNNIDIWN